MRSLPIRSALTAAATSLRGRIEPHFAADTTVDGVLDPHCPSRGHCAAVAAAAREAWLHRPPVSGARVGFASATVDGISHWFVRLRVRRRAFDIDLTGDQFGRAAVQVARAGGLYPQSRERDPSELNAATRQRADRLAERAGMVARA